MLSLFLAGEGCPHRERLPVLKIDQILMDGLDCSLELSQLKLNSLGVDDICRDMSENTNIKEVKEEEEFPTQQLLKLSTL